MEPTIVSRTRARIAKSFAAVAMLAAALALTSAFASPAQADGSSNWNHDCRATWINNADPSGEAWSTCRSTVTGGEVKLHVDRRLQPDYSGSWKPAVHDTRIDRTVCVFGCRSATVSRQGV